MNDRHGTAWVGAEKIRPSWVQPHQPRRQHPEQHRQPRLKPERPLQQHRQRRHQQNRRVNCARGFTLLELIVALALSALVSLIGAMALGAGADFYSRHQQRLAQHADVKAAQRMLRVEWQARAKWVQVHSDSLEFDTTVPTSNPPQLGLGRVRYRCILGADGRFGLTREAGAGVGNPIGGASVGPVQAASASTGSAVAAGLAAAALGTGGSAAAAQATSAAGPLSEPEMLLGGLSICAFSALQMDENAKGKAPVRWVSDWLATNQPPRLVRVKWVGDGGDLPHTVFVAVRP